MDFKVIATDFDGTLCEDKWPEIGAPNNEIINYLKEQRAAGVKIILWTCRNDDKLGEAVRWCCELGLSFDAINENLPEVVDIFGTESRKVFAHEYIDDKFCTKFKLPYTITKYRKKPVVIEALQWDGKNHREMWNFLTGKTEDYISSCGDTFYIDHSKVNGGLIIKTLEGEHIANVGDYIVKGVKGEFYPCKPDIFELTYEEA